MCQVFRHTTTADAGSDDGNIDAKQLRNEPSQQVTHLIDGTAQYEAYFLSIVNFASLNRLTADRNPASSSSDTR